MTIGVCAGEVTHEISKAFCYSKKIKLFWINIETSDRLLKFVGKKHSSKQVINIYSEIRKANPDAKIFTTIMLGLPKENMGDIFDIAQLIAVIKPDYVHCNYFICSPNSPLAKYTQLSESCREYHLKYLIELLQKMTVHKFEMDTYCIYTKPHSRKSIKEKEKLKKYNKRNVERGLLPRHYEMKWVFKGKEG